MSAPRRTPARKDARRCRAAGERTSERAENHPARRQCAPGEAGSKASSEAEGEPQPRRGPLAATPRRRWPDPRHADDGAREPRHRHTERRWRPPRGRRGFSLLELLIAATLGAVLTVAITALFTSAGRANAEHVGHARLQESARHALGFLGRSIRGAGYFGCGGGAPSNGLRGEWRRLPECNLATPVQGFNGLAGSAAWHPDLTALPLRRGAGMPTFRRGGIDPARLRPGSDILVLRRLATPLHPLLQPASAKSDPLVVADERSALRKNRFAVLARCGAAGLFRLTSVARRGGAATLRRAVGSGTFGNRSGSGLFGGAPFGDGHGPGGAAVGLVLSEIYFVARGAGAAGGGEDAWSLWRKTSAARPAELVRGIDELQLLFAVDESPAARRLAPPGEGVGAVRGVHVAITASGANAERGGPPTRRAFAATFAVRNP